MKTAATVRLHANACFLPFRHGHSGSGCAQSLQPEGVSNFWSDTPNLLQLAPEHREEPKMIPICALR